MCVGVRACMDRVGMYVCACVRACIHACMGHGCMYVHVRTFCHRLVFCYYNFTTVSALAIIGYTFTYKTTDLEINVVHVCRSQLGWLWFSFSVASCMSK